MFNKKIIYLLFISVLILNLVGCSGEENIKTYELNINSNHEESKIDITPNKREYKEGEKVTLTVNPAEGYKFVEWQGNLTGSNEEVTFAMEKDIVALATFEAKDSSADDYGNLIFNKKGKGEINLDPIKEKYELGDTVTLKAKPAEGYKFVEWQGDLSSTSKSETITVDSNKSVTAVFEKKEYTVTISVDNLIDTAFMEKIEMNGEIIMTKEDSPANSLYYKTNKTVKHGDIIVLTATEDSSNSYAEFQGWRGDISHEEKTVELKVTNNMSIVAKFGDYFWK